MKKIKAIISVLVSVILVFAMMMPAFAASGDTCNCGNAPIIQVRGVGSTLYDGSSNEIFSAENIVNGILPVIPDLTIALAKQDTYAIVSAAKKAMDTIFAPVKYDNNASRSNTVTANCNNAPVEDYMNFQGNLSQEQILLKAAHDKLGDDHVYQFTYDWTGNPFRIAEELDAFIENVKATSGHSKVSINAESMGGAIVSTYIKEYDPFGSNIETLVMANSAFNGLEMMGQLFVGNIDVDGDKLAKLISQEIRGNSEYGSLLAYLPLFEELAKMADDIVLAQKDRLYNEIFIPIFAYIPAFWTFVPATIGEGNNTKTYGDAMDYMLSGAGIGLKKFAMDYYSVVASTKTTISRAQNGLLGIFGGGMKYYNVTNYNRYIAPVTPSSNWNSDGVIESRNTSGFATVAKITETLGDNYVQAENTGYGHISPDNVIDASTSQFPMQTWFIKNLSHINYEGDGVTDFYLWLLTSNEQKQVNSSSKYPQFMYFETSVSKLMTFKEKEEFDENGGTGITIPGLPGLPDINIPGTLPDIDIDSLLGSLAGIGNVISGIGGILGGVVGGLGDVLGGILGGIFGGGETTDPTTPTPTPTPDSSTSTTDTNTNTNTNTQEPSTPEAPSVPSAPVVVESVQTGPLLEADSSGFNIWLLVLAAVAVVAGILIIKM